jgi:hypothetical protein
MKRRGNTAIAGSSVLEWKVAGSIPDCVTAIFHWHSSGPGVDSTSNRNEYQEYILRVKAAGAYGWQPCHLHVPIVLKSGSLNLLEPLGPVKACNGIALPLPLLRSNVYSRRREACSQTDYKIWGGGDDYQLRHVRTYVSLSGAAQFDKYPKDFR